MTRALILSLMLLLCSCATVQVARQQEASVEPVREFDRAVTSMAISPQGRIFVAFDHHGSDKDPLVAELLPSGHLSPYPDTRWNQRQEGEGVSPVERFSAVAALEVDPAGFLWVLDDGMEEGYRAPGGCKLVRVDLRSDRVAQVIPIPDRLLAPSSRLKGMAVDLPGGRVYLADNGRPGILTVEISTAEGWVSLDDDPSLQAEHPFIGTAGEVLRERDGSLISGNVTFLLLSPEGDFLMYQALSSSTLYRVRTSRLGRQGERSDGGEGVRIAARTLVASAIRGDGRGGILFAGLSPGGIFRLLPDGRLDPVVSGSPFGWVADLAPTGKGELFVVTRSVGCGPGGNGCSRLYRVIPQRR